MWIDINIGLLVGFRGLLWVWLCLVGLGVWVAVLVGLLAVDVCGGLVSMWLGGLVIWLVCYSVTSCEFGCFLGLVLSGRFAVGIPAGFWWLCVGDLRLVWLGLWGID